MCVKDVKLIKLAPDLNRVKRRTLQPETADPKNQPTTDQTAESCRVDRSGSRGVLEKKFSEGKH